MVCRRFSEGNTEKIFSALSAGASGYLLKRMAPEKLLEAIREGQAIGKVRTREQALKLAREYLKESENS